MTGLSAEFYFYVLLKRLHVLFFQGNLEAFDPSVTAQIRPGCMDRNEDVCNLLIKARIENKLNAHFLFTQVNEMQTNLVWKGKTFQTLLQYLAHSHCSIKF